VPENENEAEQLKMEIVRTKRRFDYPQHVRKSIGRLQYISIATGRVPIDQRSVNDDTNKRRHRTNDTPSFAVVSVAVTILGTDNIS
jgi:hypothetical protein